MDVNKFLGLDKIDGLLSRLERRPLRLYPGQCLKERDKTVDCDSCLRHCPVGAVDLSSKIEVDFDACVDCGICVRVCPTGVFESRISEDAFLAKVAQKIGDGNTVGFSCAKQLAEPGRGETIPEVEVPCLGRLTETMLVGAAAFGADSVRLNLRGCSECEYSIGVILAKDMVQGVDRLLESWGRSVEFSLTAEPIVAENVEDEIIGTGPGDTEEYDRRELFTKFGRSLLASGMGLAEGKIDRLANVFDPPSEEYFTYRMPRRKELFLRLAKKIGVPGEKKVLSDGLPFYDLNLDQISCNFCGNCAAFCPTKALELERKETTAELRFTMSRCLGCDLCLQVCAPRALSSEPFVDLSDILTERTRSLSEQAYLKCKKCAQRFASAIESELCGFCQLREDKLQDDSWS